MALEMERRNFLAALAAVISPLASEVLAKEALDALPGVGCIDRVWLCAGDLEQGSEDRPAALLRVHEGVTRVWVELDVVWHLELGER